MTNASPYVFEDVRGKVALVTGGGSGIGASVVRALASQGAAVAVCDVRPEAAEQVAAEVCGTGGTAQAVPADVSRFADAEAAVAQTVRELGALDILVNNAGIAVDAPVEAMTEEQWHRVLGVNLHGTFHCVRAAVGPMLKSPGRTRPGGASIVNVASVTAHGVPFNANYSASKAGVVGLTGSLSRELAGRGIRANVLAPGWVRTPMNAAITEEMYARYSELDDVGRPAEPEEIAGVVLFLVSALASYVTGQVIEASGGFSVLGMFRPDDWHASNG